MSIICLQRVIHEELYITTISNTQNNVIIEVQVLAFPLIFASTKRIDYHSYISVTTLIALTKWPGDYIERRSTSTLYKYSTQECQKIVLKPVIE